MDTPLFSLRYLSLFLCISIFLVLYRPQVPRAVVVEEDASQQPLCRNPTSPFDYSAKIRRDEQLPVCKVAKMPAEVSELDLIHRQVVDDHSCGEGRPCSNHACCPKATGECNYGPLYCGTTGTSPNDVCWSNCDAKAECGRYADPVGKECPLNVCCSQWGFCGTTKEFCNVTDDNPITSCQSNCNQPGPTGKNGNVQERIIGYYEAWNHDKTCVGMNFRDIPVGALTHAYFSFGYITPGDFRVAPMDNLPTSLFSDFTAIKQRNVGLKTVVALGGWSFNDNGTTTQPVFSDMVSTQANRQLFIDNLFEFMRKYGFDGVDFDWEYPGAGDRGGKPDDGKNFVQFLKELDVVNKQEPPKYSVSFTIPTSYWYMRHFDLRAINYVDWVNLMSYDLHGVWDSTNPIGNHIYAHSNLTEIGDALNLLWRNNVPASKLNLGLGFYGRSFTLTDPSCTTPGCGFKGGANKGPCSDNSGTLTYKEIKQIIQQYNLKPYHDEEAAVKWITWNQDQWVSYDDAETFKQKIDYANEAGLSGLLIWAIDQDTDDLEALRGVIAPRSLNDYTAEADNAAYWQDATVPDCYVTDCGGACKAGFISITSQPCGNAKPVTRHSTEADSQLCCPLDGAPDPKQCRWRGNFPSCNGHCQDNEVTLELNRWGDGKYCEDGNKVYCCDSPVAKENHCYWAGVGQQCNGDDIAMTFSGTFLQIIGDIVETFGGLTGTLLVEALKAADIDALKLYCCPKDEAPNWQDCQWYGQPGSCFDNHCRIGHAVQLTDSPYGLGEDCFPRLERTRVFCCNPTHGKSPFLPVPLGNLFPNPPTGDNVDTSYGLETDDTWGTGSSKNGGDDEPSNAAFSFVVLTSPDELQVSLDKRDGSHWELFNCTNTDSEGPQTIQMVCTDVSDDSNCHKIRLGHGVLGTILQMPAGCGPGKYAVAVEMSVSEHQILPRDFGHLGHRPVVYDLTFDYDFARVPRDLGDTQLRIDYSNQEGYWDQVVAAAADTKKSRKRSLESVGGDHKRWLEEEFRDDHHFGGLSTEELHKRWFAFTVIDWLNQMLKPEIKKTFKHNLDETYKAKIVEEKWSCPGRDGYLLAQAQANVKVGTSFGFTLIATSLFPLDVRDAY